MKMKAAVLVGPRKMEVQLVDVPAPTATQVLVRVKSCGLCHSEVGRYLGKATTWRGDPLTYPARFGHEPAGIVEEVGRAVDGFKPGDRVTGIGFRGSFAEYAIVDFTSQEYVTALVKVPQNIPLEYCISEPVKCTVSIVRYSQVKFGDNVFVAGCGFMGLLVIANLAWRGLGQIIACDVIDSRLQLAKEMGATVTLNPKTVDVVKEVQSVTGGRMCDVAYEGIGKPVGVTLASQVLRYGPPSGNIILYGYHAVPDTYDLSLWGPKAPVVFSLHPEFSPDQKLDLEISMMAMERGFYPLEKLITHRYALEDTGKGFEALINTPEGFLKGIVTP
jgi:threonine dehydrogenase-like Zn-dependent dehydrogenase